MNPAGSTSRRALIVGAGIGGLAAAVALRASGWEARIFERAAHPRELGFALNLAPNAMQALKELGIADRVQVEGEITGQAEIRALDGRSLRRIHIAARHRSRRGAGSGRRRRPRTRPRVREKSRHRAAQIRAGTLCAHCAEREIGRRVARVTTTKNPSIGAARTLAACFLPERALVAAFYLGGKLDPHRELRS